MIVFILFPSAPLPIPLGPRILDEVLTPLLNDLSSAERSEVALDGLKQVMAVKSKVVLPHLIPQLVKPPANTKALALLSSVAGKYYCHRPCLLVLINKGVGQLAPELDFL